MSIDPLVIGQLRELGGEALVQKLFRTFVDHAPTRRENLRLAAETRDAEALTSAVHSLRSSSAMLGATDLSELSGRLEALADDGRIEELLTRLPELESRFSEVVERLEGELGPATSPEE